MSKQTLYTAEATATGGRDGQVRSTDGVLQLPVSAPRALGGRAGATNPEQLFAAGYAACFQQAVMVVARQEEVSLDPAFTVSCEVSLLKDGAAYGLSARLVVDLRSLPADKAEQVVRRAHDICPYSVGTRGNVDVQLALLDASGRSIPVE